MLPRQKRDARMCSRVILRVYSGPKANFRGIPGIEPGTSRTRSEHNATIQNPRAGQTWREEREDGSKLFLRQIPFSFLPPQSGRAGRGGGLRCVCCARVHRRTWDTILLFHILLHAVISVCARGTHWCSHVARYACSNTSPPAQEPSVPLLDTRL